MRFLRATHRNIYLHTRIAAQRVMKSISNFLTQKLHLQVNEQKSAVARVWERKFFGYTMSFHRKPKLKVAPVSVGRFKMKLKEHFRKARGRNLGQSIKELIPLLRGWISYFRLAEVKNIFEDLDGWIRRKYRNIIWRQWKRPKTRAKNLIKRGLDKFRAWKSAFNGRGPWWNAGASHMNIAFPKSYFDKLDLVSLLDSMRNFQLTS